MLKIFIDAATKGNPGPSGAGILLIDEQKQHQLSFPLGTLSNHQAEFATLLLVMDKLIKESLTQQTIFIYTDSKIVASTIETNHTKNNDFLPYLLRFQELERHFQLLIIQWIPESQNKGADNLARQGLQKQLKLAN